MSQQTEFYTSHQYRSTFNGNRVHQRDIDFGFEFPLVVFNPLVHLVHVFLAAGAVLAVIGTVEQRERRCDLCRQRELGTLARINRVVDRATGQGQVEAEVITLTVGNREVLPVTQNITLVRQLGCELEIVIRPLQALTEHHCKTIHLDRFVRVVIVLVVVVIAVVVHTVAIHTTIIAVVIAVHVGRIVITATDVGLAGIESRYGECIRAFTAKPRVVE